MIRVLNIVQRYSLTRYDFTQWTPQTVHPGGCRKYEKSTDARCQGYQLKYEYCRRRWRMAVPLVVEEFSFRRSIARRSNDEYRQSLLISATGSFKHTFFPYREFFSRYRTENNRSSHAIRVNPIPVLLPSALGNRGMSRPRCRVPCRVRPRHSRRATFRRKMAAVFRRPPVCVCVCVCMT